MGLSQSFSTTPLVESTLQQASSVVSSRASRHRLNYEGATNNFSLASHPLQYHRLVPNRHRIRTRANRSMLHRRFNMAVGTQVYYETTPKTMLLCLHILVHYCHNCKTGNCNTIRLADQNTHMGVLRLTFVGVLAI